MNNINMVKYYIIHVYYINQNYYRSHIKLNKFNGKYLLGEVSIPMQTRYSINNILTGIYIISKQQTQ